MKKPYSGIPYQGYRALAVESTRLNYMFQQFVIATKTQLPPNDPLMMAINAAATNIERHPEVLLAMVTLEHPLELSAFTDLIGQKASEKGNPMFLRGTETNRKVAAFISHPGIGGDQATADTIGRLAIAIHEWLMAQVPAIDDARQIRKFIEPLLQLMGTAAFLTAVAQMCAQRISIYKKMVVLNGA